MSGLFCPHCRGFVPIFQTGGGLKTSEEMKVPFLGALPFDPAVVAGGDRGRPVLEDPGETPSRKRVLDFTERVLERLSEMKPAAPTAPKAVH